MDTIVDYTSVDPTQPGEVGAVTFTPYSGPELSQQGHISATITPTYWIAIDKDGVLVANGRDYTGGWYDVGHKYNDFPKCHGPKEGQGDLNRDIATLPASACAGR